MPQPAVASYFTALHQSHELSSAPFPEQGRAIYSHYSYHMCGIYLVLSGAGEVRLFELKDFTIRQALAFN